MQLCYALLILLFFTEHNDRNTFYNKARVIVYYVYTEERGRLVSEDCSQNIQDPTDNQTSKRNKVFK